MKDNWFAPTMALFSWPVKVRWFLENLKQIELTLTWITDPMPSITGGHRKQASFISASEMIAELMARCSACGRDGKITLAFYLYGVSYFELSELTKLQEDTIEYRITRVIKYAASGACRRWLKAHKNPQTYQEFCRRS